MILMLNISNPIGRILITGNSVAGPNYGYGAQLRAKPEDSIYLTSSWMKENVSDRGPLGALYRVWGDGKQMVKGEPMDYFGFSGYTQ